jgi:murein DD-endopeptidase MepM/ murein hydrolase activator NlpD
MTNSSDAQALVAIRDRRLFPTRAPLKAAAVLAALCSLLSPSVAAAQPAGVVHTPDQVAGFQGQGGPFEAVAPLKAGDPKFKQMFMSWKKLDRVEQGTIAIPSSMPVSGTNFTSGYGVRSDPFRGRAAMHNGIDLAGPIGTQIRATADGYVQRSEWANGYGNLVEINHGRGIQTRYGHLSKSLVTPGQRVKRGDLIALMGSTGRSTGSHLHYEVRIDGKAVNPTPFMQGNDALFALQRRVAAGSAQVAMGGPAGGGK